MKIFRWLLTTMFLLALSGAFAVLWVNEQFRQEYELAGMTEVSVPRGAGLNRTAALLEEKGVVADARLFILYARLFRLVGISMAGDFAFAGSVSIEKAARRLAEGDVIVRSVTIPEGKTLAEIKKILADNPYLSGDITLELREGDKELSGQVNALADIVTEEITCAERLFLKGTGGDCHMPIGAYACKLPDGRIQLLGMVGNADGSRIKKCIVFGEEPQEAAPRAVRETGCTR